MLIICKPRCYVFVTVRIVRWLFPGENGNYLLLHGLFYRCSILSSRAKKLHLVYCCPPSLKRITENVLIPTFHLRTWIPVSYFCMYVSDFMVSVLFRSFSKGENFPWRIPASYLSSAQKPVWLPPSPINCSVIKDTVVVSESHSDRIHIFQVGFGAFSRHIFQQPICFRTFATVSSFAMIISVGE